MRRIKPGKNWPPRCIIGDGRERVGGPEWGSSSPFCAEHMSAWLVIHGNKRRAAGRLAAGRIGYNPCSPNFFQTGVWL